MTRKQSDEIRAFLVQAAAEAKKDMARLAANQFGITRQAANQHLRWLVCQGVLEATGRTRGRAYALKPLAEKSFEFAIDPGLAEDRVWRDCFADALSSLSRNVLDICHYGFTEMFNNVLDHSAGKTVAVHLTLTAATVEMVVDDDGAGIFTKIKDGLHLDDERQAILELSKGKVTTDPLRHTGEGVFFASRMFDQFSILSGRLLFHHGEPGGDWLVESSDTEHKGTLVRMRIATRSARTAKEVFDRYAPEAGGYGFTRTHVPVSLLQVGEENLVSRSQAKRLLARFERFEEVILDFHGVLTIGRAFADEVFRVFRKQNPRIRIIWTRANEEVERMIRQSLRDEDAR